MIIDAHTHVFDSSVAGSAENFPKWPGTRWGGSGPDLLHQMDEAGIDQTFLISYTPVDVMAHYPADVRASQLATFQYYLTRDYFLRVWQQAPHRFRWFPDSIDPRVPGYAERATRDLDMGASGLKLLPAFVDTALDDPRWAPIFELLAERDKPCIIDLSYWYIDQPWFAPSLYGRYASYEAYAEGVHRVLARFPTVRMSFAHYGTPRLQDRDDPAHTIHYERLDGPIAMVKEHANATLDLAAYQHLIRPDEPFPYWSALGVVQRLVEALGAERIVWGTDWPYLGVQPYPEIVRAIRTAPFLKAGEADQLFAGNALRFLGKA
jgi:predicted TIM-barrel fold metal-dependent hydrolase